MLSTLFVSFKKRNNDFRKYIIYIKNKFSASLQKMPFGVYFMSNDNKKFNICFPQSDYINEFSDLELEWGGSIVLIGSNGSGKSRLGWWLEQDLYKKRGIHTYRILAQKSLFYNSSNINVDNSKNTSTRLMYGLNSFMPEILENKENAFQYRISHKYKNNPITTYSDDFIFSITNLLSVVANEKEKFISDHKAKYELGINLEPIQTSADNLIEIWDSIMPHRQIQFKEQCVYAKSSENGSIEYDASAMSDGERVALYYLCACLSMPSNTVIIVDEPESHLHKSLNEKLWQSIMRKRKDCFFIFISHDLDFASSFNQDTKKIWIKGCKINKENIKEPLYDWQEINSDENEIPEDLLLKILGSRKKVLFCEAEDKNSLDYKTFSNVYEDFLVVPVGGCEQVKRYNDKRGFLKKFNYESFCIIDRDYMDKDEISSLESKGIKITDVSEIENVFLKEPVLDFVCKQLHIQNIQQAINKVKENVFQLINGEIESQALKRTKTQVLHDYQDMKCRKMLKR
ncbi:MAG: AAA family ATPase [Rickettsiales bacterium]|nr:AAA family ATPase [Pseudomonadota bacterium]MDA0966550.1 AAA family ATPase [Pseudomonadota bacterium]MDG4543579.1 AAA family ATPase [Rickettsiales bacterium]MDG4545726.1 AAA family ATPase [Rickettsiales bacterium]MDG4547501.1 AAA family ATPase [Rickettsiales bacterium]